MKTNRTWAWIAALALLPLVMGCAKKRPVAGVAPPSLDSDRDIPSPPSPPPPSRPSRSIGPLDEEEWFRTATLEELQARMADVYFDYDVSDLKSEARATMERNAEWLLKGYNTAVLEVEGHCDERGTSEYNLALGERRSNSAADYLVRLGVSRNRMRTISYGKERPQCTSSQESCWQKNRRAHFRIASKGTS